MRRILCISLGGTAAALALFLFLSRAPASGLAEHSHETGTFSGAKVKDGNVRHDRMKDGKETLTLSGEFKVPDTPDPHWQIVDTKGNTYLLHRLMIKGDKLNKTITVPAYIKDVQKVQIWCAWAETVLGEAKFSAPLRLAHVVPKA